MNKEKLKNLICEIVKSATVLKNKHTNQEDAYVNYACIFSQSNDEYVELVEGANEIGIIIEETPTGPLFQIQPLETVAGNLKLLKIRKPDKSRPERGDADFTVENYEGLKEKYLARDNFKLIEREEFEMIELMDSDFNVRVYFSNPPLDKQLNIK